MKTPREILLERHRNAETKLDAIRKEALAEFAATPATESAERFSISCAARGLWSELIQPYRRIWAGLAAVWVVILALNLAAGGGDSGPKMAQTKMTPPTPEVAEALREQKQLMAELLGQNTPLPAEPQPKIPGRRGELRREETIVIV